MGSEMCIRDSSHSVRTNSSWLARGQGLSFYFSQFEHRTPPKPVEYNPLVHSAGQICLIIALVTGAWYISWRWTSSLNYEALWFSIPLVVAETGSYIGLILFVFNAYRHEPVPKTPEAPLCISDCFGGGEYGTRPISVDVFFLPTMKMWSWFD